MERALCGTDDRYEWGFGLSTFKKFAEELVEAFKPADRTTEAMNRLVVLKQGDRTAEELVTEF